MCEIFACFLNKIVNDKKFRSKPHWSISTSFDFLKGFSDLSDSRDFVFKIHAKYLDKRKASIIALSRSNFKANYFQGGLKFF